MNTRVLLLMALLAGCDRAAPPERGVDQRPASQRALAPATAKGFAGVAEVFQVGPPLAQHVRRAAATLQPPLPYARPDLSVDPAERDAAMAMRAAIVNQDMRQALALASTPALQQMYSEARREHDLDRAANRKASEADTEPEGFRH
ncbi:MAG TPA: hypothetical protein VIT92_05760 [Burkholderiaceae bacterium]